MTLRVIAVPVVLVIFAPNVMRAEPPKVEVARPLAREVVDYAIFTGRTDASQSVNIRSRSTGYIDKILFKEGSLVKKDQTLFEIDARLYQAALDQAKAQLALAEAQVTLQKKNLERMKKLFDIGGAAKEDFEKSVAEYEESQAKIAAAKASVVVAELNLSYTKVKSPIDGRIGRIYYTAGNLVKDDTTLAVVLSADPIYVYIDVDERTFVRLRRTLREGKKEDTNVSVGIALADEEGYPHAAALALTSSQVNPTTGTVSCRAVLRNPKDLIVPGMFVKVQLPTSTPHQALLVPESAFDPLTQILDNNGKEKRYLWILNADNVAERRVVKRGLRYDELRAAEGLTKEDRIILSPAEIKEGKVYEPKLVELPIPTPSGKEKTKP